MEDIIDNLPRNISNNELIISPVSQETRFANYMVDSFCVFLLLMLNVMILDVWLQVIPEDGSNWLALYFFFLYAFYHFIFEQFFGKTIGKFITKTKVVTQNGLKPSFSAILSRNIGRLIPFDAISFLFSKRGFHDYISKTYVVNQ